MIGDYAIMPNSSPVVVLVLLWLWSMAFVAFAFAWHTLFNRVSERASVSFHPLYPSVAGDRCEWHALSCATRYECTL